MEFFTENTDFFQRKAHKDFFIFLENIFKFTKNHQR